MNGKGAPTKSLIWIGLALIGSVGGLLLGHYVVGDNAAAPGGRASYADVTGNPHAPSAPPTPIEACHDCTDGYGRGVRHDPGREARMDHAFREFGAVEIDHPPDVEPEYHYGGNFDDPDAARMIVMQSPVPMTLPVQQPERGPADQVIDPPPTIETDVTPQH